jgi:drug/metabolite transporter (DMT)-like permease
VLITKRARQSISDSAVNVWPIPKADLNLKIIIGLCLCIIGAIIWAVPLVTASVIVHPGDISLGVIIGGGLIASGILLIFLPTHPIRVSYFDKRP